MQSKEVNILKLDDILPNRFQPRIVFDESAINELAESIKQYGVIEPIIVRKVSDKYEIIAGERRYKASLLAGKESIPAIIVDLNDKDSAEIALIENVQRQNLTPIEEAISYKKILDMGYMNQGDLGKKLGKNQSTIANKLRLLNLTEEVQEALLQEKISERHARSLLRLPSDKQNEMLDRITKERMTVRKTDEEITKILSGESTETPVEKAIEPTIEVKEDKEEKGEVSMNNSFMNHFNIPNVPIMETPKPEEQPVEPVAPQVVPPVAPAPETPVMPEIPVMPVQPEAPAMQQPVEQVNEVTPQVAPLINEVPQVQTINNEEATPENEDTPISGRFFNMFGEQPAEEEASEGLPVQPEAPVMPEIAPIEQPASQPVMPEVQVAQMQQAPFNPFTAPATPQQQNNIEPIPMPNVPATPIPEQVVGMQQPEIAPAQTFQLNDNQEFTNASVVEMGTLGNTKMEEPTLEPLMENNGPVQKIDMKEVINLIRNCAAEIERNGYKIDTDELDFEDSYQVIFKIEKQD